MNNLVQVSLCNFIKEVYNVDVAYSQVDSYEKLRTFMKDSAMSLRMINTELAANMNFVLASAELQLMPARSVDISRNQLAEIFCRRLYEADTLKKDPVFESTMTVLAGYAETVNPALKEKLMSDTSRQNVESCLISAAIQSMDALCFDMQAFIARRYKYRCKADFTNYPASVSEILDVVYNRAEPSEEPVKKQRLHPYVILTAIGIVALIPTFIYLRSKGLL